MDKYLRQAAEKLATIDSTGSFHEDTVPTLLVLFRQHLEANNLKSRYRITNFYCNWSLHVSLDKGIVQDILQEISDIISDENETNYNDRINEILSMRRLRMELVEILDGIGAKSKLFNSHTGWRAFLKVLLRSLIDKPIERRGTSTLAKFAGKLTLNVPDLTQLEQDYITNNQISSNAVFWQVLVLPMDYTLIGPLVLTEHPEDFDTA